MAMRIACLGGGPAGLYFAISMKLRDPGHDVTVIERNRADGWLDEWRLTEAALSIINLLELRERGHLLDRPSGAREKDQLSSRKIE